MNDRLTLESEVPTDLRRITTIGDSVFAVALTLLAVGARLPSDLLGKRLGFADLSPLFHDMGAIAMSFCVASVFWLGHGIYLRNVLRTTVPFLIANLFFLLCIVFLPITTRVLSAGPLGTASAAIYSANLLAMAVAQLLFRRMALRLSLPVGGTLPRARVHRHLAPYSGIAIHGTALVLAFVDPRLSLAAWGLALSIPLVEAWTHRMNKSSP